MLLIYTSSVTNRLRYTCKLIFGDLLGTDCAFTSFPDEFTSYEGPKLVYAPEPLNGELFIRSENLLFEEHVHPLEPEIGMENYIPVLFQNQDRASALPFDPLAASFFMVTRYEEYERQRHDRYGRFPATSSVAFKGKFLELPVVHFWADMLLEMIQKRFPGLRTKRPVYHFVPTIDIDHVYAYKSRPLSRTAGGIARSAMKMDINDIIERFLVLGGTKPDPYDTYDYINGIHKKYGATPYYFILFADYGGNDNNIPVHSKSMRNVIRALDQQGMVGIHPSLSSNKHLRKLSKEHSGLCSMLERDVTVSRQHFMKISFPRTYRNLINLGITDDFSMGYASHPGFRSGMALPYWFFDLSRNETAPLKIHPVTLMDVTMKDYLRLTPEQSIETIHRLISMVRSVGGEFVSLCHNETFSESGRWIGWRNIYEDLLRFAVQQG